MLSARSGILSRSCPIRSKVFSGSARVTAGQPQSSGRSASRRVGAMAFAASPFAASQSSGSIALRGPSPQGDPRWPRARRILPRQPP
eukprot:166853-Lingulodinium_polyedra.AAC.1